MLMKFLDWFDNQWLKWFSTEDETSMRVDSCMEYFINEIARIQAFHASNVELAWKTFESSAKDWPAFQQASETVSHSAADVMRARQETADMYNAKLRKLQQQTRHNVYTIERSIKLARALKAWAQP